MNEASTGPASPPPQSREPELPYASAAARAAAAILDLIAVNLLFVMALFGAIALGPRDASFDILGPVLAVAIPWLYSAGFEASAAKATPGKKQLGIVVTDAHGARIGFARASVRFVGKILLLATFGLALFAIYLDRHRRALDDLIAGTRVLDAEAMAPGRPLPMWRKAIVLAIVIGLVAWAGKIAIDAQNDFRQRARTSTAMLAGEKVRPLVAEYYARTGRLPQNGAEAGLSPAQGASGEAHSSVAIRGNGVVVIMLAPTRDWPIGGEITLAPTAAPDGKSLKWKCRSTLPARVVPAACRD